MARSMCSVPVYLVVSSTEYTGLEANWNDRFEVCLCPYVIRLNCAKRIYLYFVNRTQQLVASWWCSLKCNSTSMKLVRAGNSFNESCVSIIPELSNVSIFYVRFSTAFHFIQFKSDIYDLALGLWLLLQKIKTTNKIYCFHWSHHFIQFIIKKCSIFL